MTNIGHINASVRTDQGRVRDHNEDFVAYREPAEIDDEARNGWLYVIADGVGGAEAGEIASQYATERMIHHYFANEERVDWGGRLRQAMQAANSDLRQLIVEQAGGGRMATTMVAAVIYEDKATIANVGDSRGYHLQNGVIKQITKDHSLVARLLEEGAITEEEAINHPRKNIILHSLGSESTPQIDLYDLALLPGEHLVLCSDGLTRHVSDEEIAEMVSESGPAEATDALIQLANERGGEDNISVAVLRIGEPLAVESASASLAFELTADRNARSEDVAARRALWIYTAILCLTETVLIILIWFLING